MLTEQTLERLNAMKLHGMASYLRTWLDKPSADVTPVDLVGLLADAEWMYRENRKLTLRLKNAKLRQPACVEDIDYGHARGLTKAEMLELSSCRWVAAHQNVLLTGPTGVGKSYLACALGNKACREGYSVAYRRASRLFDELAQARADGTYPNVLKRLAKVQVLILDDFGLEPLGRTSARNCSKSLRTATATVPPSSPPSSSPRTGTPSLATPPWPTPSSIASSTTRTVSGSLATPSDARTRN